MRILGKRNIGIALILVSILGTVYWQERRSKAVVRLLPRSLKSQLQPTEQIQQDTQDADIKSGKPKKFPATSSFKSFTKPAVQELKQDPELGEIVEITLENGGKVYRYNDEVYDVSNDTFSKKTFSN